MATKSNLSKFGRFASTVALLLGELLLSLSSVYIAALLIKAFGEAMEKVYK